MNPIHIGSRRELFVDTYLIDAMRDAWLQLAHPERREAIVFDAPWESGSAFGNSVLQLPDGVVRLYCRAGILDSNAVEDSTLYSVMESRDGGLTFTRPNLGMVAFDGSRENNLYAMTFPKCGGVPFRDLNPDCREDDRFKAFGLHRRRPYAMCSEDGLHWRKMRDAPLEYSGGWDTINTAFWDSVTGCYRSYTRRWVNVPTEGGGTTRVRMIQMATSPDFLHWDSPVLNEYEDGIEAVQLYTNATVPCPGAEHIYLSFPNRMMQGRWLQRDDATAPRTQACNDALFMSSRDGMHWNRSLDAWVRPGLDDLNWLHRSNYPIWGIVRTSDTQWSMWISEHYALPDAPMRLRRLSIRPHGFMSVHADYRGGEFVTRPMVFDGTYLRLNFATSAAGSIQVEVQDADGKPYEGFTLGDMPPLFGDALDAGVCWNAGGDLSSLAGKAIRLRFVLRDADIFAMRFTQEKPVLLRGKVAAKPASNYNSNARETEIRVPRAQAPMTIDGSLDAWDMSTAVTITTVDEFADTCRARVALRYDDDALYIAADIADPFPMVNTMTSFAGDLNHSWSSDALQMHLQAVTDSESDAPLINDIRLWYSTADEAAGCHIIPGIDFDRGRLNPEGTQGVYMKREDGSGYRFEYRIPWHALNSTRAPRPGERITATILCHWGKESGDTLLCGGAEVRSDNAHEVYIPESWGAAVFE